MILMSAAHVASRRKPSVVAGVRRKRGPEMSALVPVGPAAQATVIARSGLRMNGGGIGTNVDSLNYGQVTSAHDPRQIQLGGKLYF